MYVFDEWAADFTVCITNISALYARFHVGENLNRKCE